MHSHCTDGFCGGWLASEVCFAHGSLPDSPKETLVMAMVGQHHGRGSLGATPGLTPGCHLHQAFVK